MIVTDSISQAIVHMFDHERFYAEIISQMHRIIDNKMQFIAGVRIKNRIELFINEELFSKLPLEERAAILKHECEHILRDHIPRAKELAPEVYKKADTHEDDIMNAMKHKTLNIAMDCAINCHIKHIPKTGVFPKLFNLKDNQTMEWYLDNLKNNEKAKDFMEFDGHSLWSDSEDSEAILREKIRQAINKAAEKTRNAGQMTASDELLVSNLNKKHMVNWREQLKQFVANTIETKIESSRKKRNRRYGITFPGHVKIEELSLGVAIDTSGSVSDAALTQFMTEIGQIAKYAKVIVVEADSEIKNHYVFKPQKEYKISGRGGTAYQPAFDFFNEEKNVDAVIYFGDMDCFDTREIKKPKYPVLWAIVGDSEPPAKFGRKIKVKIS